MKVNIIMAAFNQWDMSERSIKSILKNTNLDYRLIFINNGSTDNTHDMFMEKFSDNDNITYLRAEKNGGCGIGRNIGLRKLDDDCEFVILVDNDIYAPDGWAEKMVAVMTAHPKLGIGGAATNFAGTPQLIPNVPPLETDEEIEEYSRNHSFPKEFIIVPPRWTVIGFCQIVRRELYDTVGLFDEEFKLYGCEDNDFCLRSQMAGWHLAYINSVFVYHDGHGGLSQLGADGSSQWGKNREYFKKKHGFI